MKQCILVTGAEGFLGRHVAMEALRCPDVWIVGIGRSRRSTPPLARERYEYRAVDVLDTARLAAVIEECLPTIILHLASGLRDDMPMHLVQVNVTGTLSLFDAILQSGVKPRVVIASSGGVYGRSTRQPLTEEAPCEPIDLYGASKLAQEHVARITGATHGVDVIVARIFNLIGPGQDERHACARFARQLARADSNASFRVEVGDLSPTRDFVDVRDAAGAVLHLARDRHAGGLYNVASGIETSMETLLRLTCAAAGLSEVPEVLRTYARPTDIPRHVADVTKLEASGYRLRYELAQSVAELVAYYRVGA